MSRTTRRKHVIKEMLDDDYELPKENQQIVRIVCSRGNNLHEVEAANGDKFLASMPSKFRKNVWVKRGDFLIVDPIEEGDKVKGEISRILTPIHIKEFSKYGVWPKQFTKKRDLDEDGSELPAGNVNRRHQYTSEESEEDSSKDEELEEENNLTEK